MDKVRLREKIIKITEGEINTQDEWVSVFRAKSDRFSVLSKRLQDYENSYHKNFLHIGNIEFENGRLLGVFSIRVEESLTERTGKKKQYDKAKEFFKANALYDGGIFIFYDEENRFRFRFSLIYPEYKGTKRNFSDFKRHTYYIDKKYSNRTFIDQFTKIDWNTLEDVKDTFSIYAVTKDFYGEFIKHFESLSESVLKYNNKARKSENVVNLDKKITKKEAEDFTLLFIIRTLFIGFVQKRGWINNDVNFLQNLLSSYKENREDSSNFYRDWLSKFFFNALNRASGDNMKFTDVDLPEKIQESFINSPFLNGELFKIKPEDKHETLVLEDESLEQFFNFIFDYNFTIEENKLNDEELGLNPEFLGIIFERLVNKKDGAIYTQRTEVDLMCRLALVKWLIKNISFPSRKKELYELFFRERGTDKAYDEDQRYGSFSHNEAKEILELLEDVKIADPAVGSGAFPVGMIQVIDETEQILRAKHLGEDDFVIEERAFDRKKRIIENSLYGVEVKHWAVWIAQLRLWIKLFIDAPDDLRYSEDPILPSLDFKIRQGDSLIQKVGSKLFPVSGFPNVSIDTKDKIVTLQQLKKDYYENKLHAKKKIESLEAEVFMDIISEELDGKKSELKKLKGSLDNVTDQIGLVGNVDEKFEGNKKDKKEKINEIKSQIKELKEIRVSLSETKNRPLVWNIEFSEIFGGRGGFDIVIGNPPYVRQEDIADPMERIEDPKEYKDLLGEMVKTDFSEYYSPKENISKKSDLYTYFYMRGLRLLNQKGVLCYICSNSWLDVGYGSWLQEFLLNHAPADLIIDNHAKRSFKDADVNTIITLINAPKDEVDENEVAKFVAFKKPFEESIFTEKLLDIESANKVGKDEVARIFPITAGELLREGSEDSEELLGDRKYIGDKWGGKYLRAPDIFFTILEKGKDKLVKLGDIAEVRFGIKTGANDFFYLTDADVAKWKIEEEFLKPVIKSPRECKSIMIDPDKLKYKVFLCNKSKKELRGTNALKYIQWGESVEFKVKQGKNKGKSTIGYHNVSSVQGRKYWWSLGDRERSIGIFPAGINDSYKVYLNEDVCLVDKRLYEITETGVKSILVLNSTLYQLLQEINSRVGLGEGLLDLTVYEVASTYLLNPKALEINPNEYKDFLSRDISSVFEESRIDPESDIPISKQEPNPLPDRAKLDKVVFDALELTEEERKDVYRAVCQLVWNRINKAGNK